MSLHEDLRRQAWYLATREPRRPLQASLRRSVSTGYYALFHLLVSEATAAMFGHRRDRRAFRHIAARAFTHQSMGRACRSFGSGTLPAVVTTVLPAAAVPADLRLVARVFVYLQEARHRADYSVGEPFLRSEVRAVLREVDGAFEAWSRVRSENVSRSS